MRLPKSLRKGSLSSNGFFDRQTRVTQMRAKKIAAATTGLLTTFAASSQAWVGVAAFSQRNVVSDNQRRSFKGCHQPYREREWIPGERLGPSVIVRQMVSTFPNEEAISVEGEEWRDVLPFEKSAHNSATIYVPEDSTQAMFDKETFRSRLESTCEVLRELKKSSVWVEVPMCRASFIEEMSSLGFEYHHAEGTTARLNLWLLNSESKVPEYATHHVGVGAVVINSRNEILCVRELRKNYMPWKVPGGLSELGESIADAAQREVLEETGIPTKFHSILSFRHTHGLANGRSDLYFVCRLDPVEGVDDDGNAVIPEPTAQASEIEATAWVPLSEYRAMVDGTDGQPGHPMMRHVMEIYDQGLRIKQKHVNSVVPGRKPNPLYLPTVTDSDSGQGK